MQARALGVAAATAGVAFSTTAMPAQGAHFLHLIAYAIWLVSTSNQQLAGWQSLPPCHCADTSVLCVPLHAGHQCLELFLCR